MWSDTCAVAVCTFSMVTNGRCYVIPHEWIGRRSSNLVAGLVTWPTMYENCSRSRNISAARMLGSGWSYQLETWWKLSPWESTPVVYFLRQWVKQTGSRNMSDIQHIICRNQRKTSSNRWFCTLVGNQGGRIERRCLNLHRKFINNRFCACAVQMLLKMAVNAAICSIFEVQYDKSTSARTTALRHLGHLKQIRWFRACAESHTFFNTGRALFSQITLIIFIVEPPKLYSE